MQSLPRWRSLLILKNSLLVQSTGIASTSITHLADFHSTRVSHDKWRNKWTSASHKRTPGQRSSQTPSKDYIKYKTRQKRADAKKALKNLLFNSGFSNVSFEETYVETDALSDVDEEEPLEKKDQSKSSHAARRAAKAQHRRMKRKWRREKERVHIFDHEKVFQESLRKRGCTWSYWDPFFQSSASGFDFKKHWDWSYRRPRESDIESESEPDAEPCISGSNSERQVLGLPLRGPLNIQDVKNA
ncbi:OLC1v1008812C2 [Oldenlandia corymbosa var. corymbosa]|nr:OLC1v1008812C2 [Oldenlandia corymbosa var. corymbosa]